MNFEHENYEIIEIFEENVNQLILMAIEKENYEDVVIINKITKSDIINSDFVSAYKLASSNLINISENKDQVIIINNYKDTTLLVDYLKENSLEFKERIRIAKSFIFQISNYSNLVYSIQKLLISTSQLTMDNNILLFSDYLFLDNFDSNTTFKQLLSSIGKTLRLILQLQKESLSSENSLLDSFVTSLVDNETSFTSFNHIYNQFKIVLSNQNNTKNEIKYKEISTLENSSVKPKIDLEFIKQQQRAKRVSSQQTTLHNESIIAPIELVNNVSKEVIAEVVKELTQTVMNNKILTNNLTKPDVDEFEEYSIELPELDDYEISYDFDDSELSIEFIEYPDDESVIAKNDELELSSLEFDNLELDINPNFISDFDSKDTLNDENLNIDKKTFPESDVENSDLLENDNDNDNESNNLTSDILSILDELTINTDVEYNQENNKTIENVFEHLATEKKIQTENESNNYIELSLETLFDSWIDDDELSDAKVVENVIKSTAKVNGNSEKLVISEPKTPPKSKIETINKKAENVIINIPEPVVEETKKSIKDIVKDIPEPVVEETKESIEDIVKDIPEPVVEKNEERIKDIVKDIPKPVVEETKESIEDIVKDIPEPVVEKNEEKIKDIVKDIPKPVVEKNEESIEDIVKDIPEPIVEKIEESIDNKSEEKVDSEPFNHINDLLKRNNTYDKHLSIDDTKYKEKKHIPTFLYFFILLLLLTFALLTYTSTYI